MTAYEKLALDVVNGITKTGIRFDDLRKFLIHLGFDEHILGNHFVFSREGAAEILNLQPRDSKVKPYQLRQVSRLLRQGGIS